MIRLALKNKLFLFSIGIYVFFTPVIFACDCPKAQPITETQVGSYEAVVLGKVLSVTPGKNFCTAKIAGIAVYHGVVRDTFEVQFDCSTTCAIPVGPGETWLWYMEREKADWKADFCSRTRKQPVNDELDDYTVYLELTWNGEIEFLNQYFPKKDFYKDSTDLKENVQIIDQNRLLQHANQEETLILIGCSILGMIGMYFLVRFLFRKEPKRKKK